MGYRLPLRPLGYRSAREHLEEELRIERSAREHLEERLKALERSLGMEDTRISDDQKWALSAKREKQRIYNEQSSEAPEAKMDFPRPEDGGFMKRRWRIYEVSPPPFHFMGEIVFVSNFYYYYYLFFSSAGNRLVRGSPSSSRRFHLSPIEVMFFHLVGELV